eukprot:g942.t1
MAGRGLRELKKACLQYVAGVEQNKRQYGLEENIAIVEFGRHQQVLCHLTDNYDELRKVINSLQSSGRTPMAEALGHALVEILQHGGVLTIRGHKITPRIVLMTDGKPTDEEGETKAVEKVAAFGVAFGQAWKEVGLPHPVPIACVGCGDCDADLLNGLARVTGGMATLVDDLGELTNFFKKQVLLTRFVAQFEGDLRRALTMEALREFFRGELEQDLQGAELAAMLQLLGTMLRLEGRDSQIVGEQVTISADVTSVKRSAAGFGEWVDSMAAYCGKTGTLVEAAPPNGKLTVRFSDGRQVFFNPSVVTRANPRGPIGSRVTVLADEDRVRQLAKGHGIVWKTGMSRTIGRSGEVLKVDSDGDVRVFFRDMNLQFLYHPEALVGYQPYGATAVTEATWSCIACATQHTEGKAVLSNCRNCGTPRGSAAAAPAQRHVAPAAATLPWICTQCKASNTSSGFCGSCGTAKGPCLPLQTNMRSGRAPAVPLKTAPVTSVGCAVKGAYRFRPFRQRRGLAGYAL